MHNLLMTIKVGRSCKSVCGAGTILNIAFERPYARGVMHRRKMPPHIILPVARLATQPTHEPLAHQLDRLQLSFDLHFAVGQHQAFWSLV
jgi:hypothetical protein